MSDSFQYFLCLCFVSRFAEKGEHILLVSLYAGLVERIDSEQVGRNAAGELEEVEDGAEIVLVYLFYSDLDLGYAAVDVGKLGAEGCHCVAMLHVLAGKVVQLVQVLGIVADNYAALGFLDLDHGLEHHAVTFLDELAHGVEVGGEVDRCGEDTLLVLALGLAVELLPPFSEILELGIVVHQDLDLLTGLAVKEITHCGIFHGCVLLPFFEELGTFVGSALEHGADIESSQHYGQQAHRSEYGETAPHVVGNHEGAVTFLGGKGLEGTLLGVCDGHGAGGSLILAIFVLEIVFHDTERNRGFGGGSGLGDDHASGVALPDEIHELCEIVLAEVVAGEYHAHLALGADELMGESLDCAAGAEIASADADDYCQVHSTILPVCLYGLAVSDEAFGSIDRKSLPTEEIVSGTFFTFEDVEGVKCLAKVFFVIRFFYEGAAAPQFNFYHMSRVYFSNNGHKITKILLTFVVMTLKNITVIAAVALLALTSCAGKKSGYPTIDQKGKTAIVAHRGYWNCEAGGFAQNSIASLKAAQDNGFWGSEFDVHITTDDVVLVFHNDDVDGVRIDTSAAERFAEHRLANGEKIPTIDEYLTQGEKSSKTMLVLELKPEITMEREDALVDKCIEALEAHKLLEPTRVMFISFSKYICDRIAAEYPDFINQYLNGDYSPEELADYDINGFDYHDKAILKDSTIVERAKKLGMSTNVWTVNKPELMQKFIELGIGAITTNEPMALREILGENEYKTK